MFNHLPDVTNQTPEERISALHEAKILVTATPASGGVAQALVGRSSVSAPDVDSMIRVAEYINTGHDYRDTHDQRKERKTYGLASAGTLLMPMSIFFEDNIEVRDEEKADEPDPDGEQAEGGPEDAGEETPGADPR